MTADIDSAEDEIIATLSDYVDGTLAADRRAEVETKLATDPTWQRVHGELKDTRNAMSGLQKARAPATFASEVTTKLHKRSAGRFFARRTFGDRVPFSALMVVALIGLVIIAYVLWASTTGSLKVDHHPAPHPAGDVVPKP